MDYIKHVKDRLDASRAELNRLVIQIENGRASIKEMENGALRLAGVIEQYGTDLKMLEEGISKANGSNGLVEVAESSQEVSQ